MDGLERERIKGEGLERKRLEGKGLKEFLVLRQQYFFTVDVISGTCSCIVELKEAVNM